MKQATRFTVDSSWKMLLADLGIGETALLRLAGLPVDLFSRQGATLEVDDYFSFWRGLEQFAGEKELALLIGQAISPEMFNPALFASFCSPDLNTAMKRMQQYKPLCGPMNLTLEIDEVATSVTVDCAGYCKRIPASLGAMDAVFFTQLARMGTRHRITPTEVVFAHTPADRKAYEEFFGVPVTVGDVYRTTFSAEDASMPFLSENHGMWEFFEPALNKRLSELEEGASTSARVRSLLLEMLPRGESSVDDAAGYLAMSKRTLQRKLTDERQSFQGILKATRKDLAEYYLSNSTIPQGEISFLLGFQDTNSFTRAFSNWTGQTPGQYRLTTIQ
ncbi:AraC family transcriptional regulator [Desulfovibrio mangrovi]|uniref:AraC family transcriptional regulator n=1 Tax=Desulfovibrio mangrovi TaxID=2976983 RepID=UPI002247E364|nr:AraC family transcriptional regulator [Desulfovibrio mangrovi]UZP68125.1 AraC family transcriptional regulator [Desulfovibrio mangrovi]